MGEKRFRNKPRARPRDSSQDTTHWLGEGSVGQEVLAEEFDPLLYVADSVVCRLSLETGYKLSIRGEAPRALLMGFEDPALWYVGFLSEVFAVAVWADLEDEVSYRTVTSHSALPLDEGIPPELEGTFSLSLCTHYDWESEDEILHWSQLAVQNIRDGGRAIFLARAEKTAANDEVTIRWADGSGTPLESFLASSVSAGISFVTGDFCSLERARPAENQYFADFLKRHRRFFGKSARDLLLLQMSSQRVPAPPDASYGLVVITFA